MDERHTDKAKSSGRGAEGRLRSSGNCTSDRISVQVLDRMRRLCARRECCTSEMYRKAFDAFSKAHLKIGAVGSGGPEVSEAASAAASAIVASLVSDGYVDDSRYAAAFARDKSSLSGWGPRKIRNALAAKGLSEYVISEALAATDSSASASRMEKVLEVKFRSLRRTASPASSVGGADEHGYASYHDPETLRRRDIRLRMLRFAIGRGYGYEEAAPVIERLLSEL